MKGNGLALVLALLSGFVDTAVFVRLGGLFVAHVTGNFVLLGATIAGSPAGGHAAVATLQLAAFPLFVAAAMLGAVLAGAAPPQRTRPLLALVAMIMLAAAGASAADVTDPVIAMVFVVAMGLLNAVHRLDTSLGPPFTVMTGNVTGLAIFLARRLHLAPADTGPPPVAGLAVLVVGFALGCAGGAVAVGPLGLAANAIPALLLLVLLLPLRR